MIINNSSLNRKYKSIEKLSNKGAKETILNDHFYWKSFSKTIIENNPLKRKYKKENRQLNYQ